MLEEIKKEINQLPLYAQTVPRPAIDYLDVMEILDKYDNQTELFKFANKTLQDENKELLKFKNAFEELLDLYENKFKDTYSKNDVMVLGILKDLKKKYNLGGE